jgi:hypothetical protein
MVFPIEFGVRARNMAVELVRSRGINQDSLAAKPSGDFQNITLKNREIRAIHTETA